MSLLACVAGRSFGRARGHMRLKDISTIAATWVSIAAAITGGYFGLQSYRASVEAQRQAEERRLDERVLQTFTLFQRFEGGELAAAREALLGEPPAQGNREIYALIDFFDVVWLCVEQEICDRESALHLFGPYAQGYYEALQPIVAHNREAEALSIQVVRPSGWGLQNIAAAAAQPAD